MAKFEQIDEDINRLPNFHQIEVILQKNGQLVLEDLPFKKGESVKVIILGNHQLSSNFNDYPLAGKVVEYNEPYESATDIQDWEALK